jgi:hypothetical protein
VRLPVGEGRNVTLRSFYGSNVTLLPFESTMDRRPAMPTSHTRIISHKITAVTWRFPSRHLGNSLNMSVNNQNWRSCAENRAERTTAKGGRQRSRPPWWCVTLAQRA